MSYTLSRIFLSRFVRARSVRHGIAVLCLFTAQITVAQFRFDSWTTDNGLPQNGVRQITQTPDGYLWFTTFDGLVRFDGVKFTVFDKGNTPGITTNRFSVLYAAHDGSLWAAAEDGSITIYRNGVFTSYDRLSDQFPAVDRFYDDEQGVTAAQNHDSVFYLRDGHFVRSGPSPPLDPDRIDFTGPTGTHWVIRPTGVTRIKEGVSTNFPITISQFETISIPFEGIEDKAGGFWFGKTGTVFHVHDGRVETVSNKDNFPTTTWPHDFWEESDGSIWFATGDANLPGIGLVRWKEGKLEHFGLEAGLSNDRTWRVFRDREGTVWVATNKGLNRLRRQTMRSYTTKEGLIYDEVYPLAKAANGDILIGTAQGLSRYRNGVFINSPMAHPGYAFDYIQSLAEDARGRLWTGVIGGLVRYDHGFRSAFDVGSTANAIVSGRDGAIWVGTDGAGLVRIDVDKMTARYTTAEGLVGDEIKTLWEDSDGSLWIGTYQGLSHFQNGKFKNYTEKDGLVGNRVRSIYKDADGTFWIGTYDAGLSRFKDGKFFNYTVENGLFNNGVFAILEDDRGNFWMSCNRGIYRVSKQQLNDFADGKITRYEAFSYGKEDGMNNTECNGGRQPAAIKDTDGKLWFPTLGGVVVIDPSLVSTNPLPPPVAIENVAVDRKEIPPAQQFAIANDSNQAVTLKPAQTSIDITYTGLSFIKSDQIRFRYKLDGLDKDWVEAGTRRTVNYSYLPPGKYVFTVTAANSDGIWNLQGKSIRIVVLAPFYRTWWFRTLAVVAFLGFVFLLYRYRVMHLRKEHRAREAFSREMIESQEAFSRQLIESQEGERKRIAAELHDSLGQNLLVIKNRALLGLSFAEKERSREQFGEIQESVSMALNEVRSIAYNLRPLHLERLGLTSTVEEAIEQVEAASGIMIECDIAPLDDLFSSENEINFYRIIQECLNNIVKHSQATKASVTVHRVGGEVSLVVRDNGRGFDLDQLQEQHRLGLGLNGIAERVKILGGTHSIVSVPGEGTTIAVEIGEGGKR